MVTQKIQDMHVGGDQSDSSSRVGLAGYLFADGTSFEVIGDVRILPKPPIKVTNAKRTLTDGSDDLIARLYFYHSAGL